jgi:hypothetical protein
MHVSDKQLIRTSLILDYNSSVNSDARAFIPRCQRMVC